MASAPQSSQFSQTTVYDYLFDFVDGQNAGESPLLLPKNQLAWGSNLTTRGALVHPRPPRRILTLTFPSQAIQTAFTTGLFQAYCYYKPDLGLETLMVAISGRLYQITPVGTTATVADVTGANPQSPTALLNWLIQAENYVLWNDGINLPVFFNGTTTTRSNGTPAPSPTFTIQTRFFIPVGYNITSNPPPPPPIIAIALTGNFTGANGDPFVINGGSTFPISGNVTAGAGTPNIQVTVNIAGTSPPTAIPVEAGSILTSPPAVAVRQFPVGRNWAYGRGRVWMALANAKDYIAGDIVHGPSGTKALDYRDSILNVTENDYLVGGGIFTIPGSIGDIRAMIFTAQTDTALGQGPLMIFTPTHVFSCNAPVDRLTWQTLTNPIQTETAIGNGGLGQDSTFLVNSDTMYRSVDGIRSLILSSQDFNTWIRTPISHEVERVLSRDNQALLAFGRGVFFDNRALMTASPISTPQGVYHKALIALNTDLITTVREKKPPAYDGTWPGLNIMGITTGEFSAVERCYTFVYNTVLQTIEVWEQMPESAGEVENNPNTPIVGDNGTQAIEWWFESPVLFKERNPAERAFKQLVNGEIMVDKLVGLVNFSVFWKPDQFPCWTLWHQWSECSIQNTGKAADNNKPGFKPRMGLGSPSSSPCDSFTNRPLNQGFNFQVKVIVVGQCEIIGMRFGAVVLPQPTFSPPSCIPVC
jgi:hypothetical protein